jgi:O-methyltransferase involved in polyketide biosynthesis
MKISATSALVLNWTDTALWQSAEALNYTSQLDLCEGGELFRMFSDEENFMHRQSISGRKYVMKNKVLNFLQEQNGKNKTGQVIVLAAGLAPLSVEIAALFPTSRVFDVDKYLMADKKKLVNGKPSNIEFVTCDISNLDTLNEKLIDHHFDQDNPTIAVLEGIIYYLPVDVLKNILRFFRQHNMAFVCDFCLKPELVNKKTSVFLTEVFRKIKEEVNLDFIHFYSAKEMTEMLEEAGYEKINIFNMQQIQEERTGEKHPFTEKDSCWVMTVYAE